MRQLTYLLTYLLSHSRGTPLSHPHCPVGQLRSRVVGPEYVGQIQGSQVVGSGRGMVGRGRGGGYYYSTLPAVSLSASLSPHLFLPSSSWLLLACSPHSTPAHLAFAAAVAPAPSNPQCARATGREQGSCVHTAYAAFFRLDQTVPVWHLALASALASCTVLSPPPPPHLPPSPLPPPPALLIPSDASHSSTSSTPAPPALWKWSDTSAEKRWPRAVGGGGEARGRRHARGESGSELRL